MISGPTRSARAVEFAMSQKSTVTCLRSPSRALLEVRIFSARCWGVYERGTAAVRSDPVAGAANGCRSSRRTVGQGDGDAARGGK